MTKYTVSINWDDDAGIWYATSPDIAGFAFESGSYDALVERLKLAIPERLQLNNQPPADELRLVTRRDIVPFNHIPAV